MNTVTLTTSPALLTLRFKAVQKAIKDANRAPPQSKSQAWDEVYRLSQEYRDAEMKFANTKPDKK
jgi:hypothetical protein